MVLRDQLGNEYTGATPAGVEHFEHGLCLLQCYVGDPVSICDKAIATAPDMVMSHALRAWLHLLSTEAPALAVARDALERTTPLPANARERGHLMAIRKLTEGRWHAAARILEDVAIAHPHDALALLVGHQLDFFTGQSRMLRDRIARALPQWNERQPGYHSLLGMQAFGLEECGDYLRAEAAGRRAVELEPRDGWAQHAVAHVFEMSGRKRDGLKWMLANPDLWSRDSFFAVHNWWHTAIFHLDLDDAEAALGLYDSAIYGRRSRLALEMIDAAALLWRLELRGIDVGDRWNALADDWEPHALSGNYAFNDVHAALAFLRADSTASLQAILEAQTNAMTRDDDNARFTREVGRPVTLALRAFHQGAWSEAADRLRGVRNRADIFGGSHAQRDLLDLTLLAAAQRSGNSGLATALEAERLAARPGSPWRLPVPAAA
jgi:tetratricopeptide (TPR) repeat protein